MTYGDERVTGTPDTHEVVGVLLCERGRVLLGRRSVSKRWYPSCWDVPGGHVEFGESPIEAAIREVQEELGVVVSTSDLAFVTAIVGDDFDLKVYTASRWSGAVINAAPHEHDEIAWLNPQDLEGRSLAHPALRDAVASALTVASFDRPPPGDSNPPSS